MTKQQKIEVEIPDKYKPAEREIIAEEILEFIRSRTEKGISKTNRAFPPLSKEYKAKKQAYGAKGIPDLTLTGDMMISMDLLKSNKGKLTIGFERGSEENAKADGHITGNVGKKRDFLGIYKKDVNAIIRQLEADGEI